MSIYISFILLECVSLLLKMKNYIIKYCIYFLCGSLLYPCTTILVGKGMTVDGSIIHAHNEDMGNLTVGRLWKVNHRIADYDSIYVPYVRIPTSETKLAYWASGNTKQINREELNQFVLPYDNILVGMNESGLTLSCNWMYSREMNLENKGIRRYAIRQLILERCSTSLEAVKLIGELIDTYGQADWGGLTYVIADQTEGWIVETTTHFWVAKKLRDDEIIAIANQYTIGENFDLSSKHLIQNAIDMGWYNSQAAPFNFKEVYGDPEYLNEAYDLDREKRVIELLDSKLGRIRPDDLMSILRDRYHDSDEYAAPTTFEPDRITCRNNGAKRPICSNLCQSSFVAHLRPNLPVEFGSVFWYTMATPSYGSYFPLYPSGDKIIRSFSINNSEETDSTAWWVYRHLQQMIDAADAEIIKRVRNETAVITKDIMSEQSEREMEIQTYLKVGDVNGSQAIINQYSNQSAIKSLNSAWEILER